MRCAMVGGCGMAEDRFTSPQVTAFTHGEPVAGLVPVQIFVVGGGCRVSETMCRATYSTRSFLAHLQTGAV